MMYNTQNCWVFGLCPSSGILKTREQNARFEVITAVTMTDVSEERRFTQDLHGVTSQKTAFLLENTTFRKLDLFPSSGEGGDTNSVASLRIPDDGQSPKTQ
jgi:hypothetical protein